MTKETFYTSAGGFGYNLKVIQYGNGSVQIRLYDEPLGVFEQREKDREIKLEREPFTGSLVREVEDFSSPVDPLESRKNSLIRTRRLIDEYARSIRWAWFCTFTFSKKKVSEQIIRNAVIKCRHGLRIQEIGKLQIFSIWLYQNCIRIWSLGIFMFYWQIQGN